MKDIIIKKLRAKGLKLTRQRDAIIEAFADKVLLHPSANTIHREVKKKKTGISLSTIYYTLNELSRKGIIDILEFEKMDNRYEGNTEAHIHLICKQCKTIIDIFPKLFRPDEIIKNVDFMVTDTRFEYYGYCTKCRRKELQLKKGHSSKINSHKK